MGDNSVRISDDGMRKKMNSLPRQVGKEVQDILLELGKIGEEEIRRSIAVAPTPFAKVRHKYGLGSPRGRVRSGRMYWSVLSRLRSGPKRSEVEVGYLRGPKQDYYYYQDSGFMNKWRFVGFGAGTYGPNAPRGFMFSGATARKTEGTHGLRNARELMLRERPRLFAQAKRRIARQGGSK